MFGFNDAIFQFVQDGGSFLIIVLFNLRTFLLLNFFIYCTVITSNFYTIKFFNYCTVKSSNFYIIEFFNYCAVTSSNFYTIKFFNCCTVISSNFYTIKYTNFFNIFKFGQSRPQQNQPIKFRNLVI